MNKLFRQIFLLTIIMTALLISSSAAYGQTAKRLPFVKGRISTTIKGVGTQSYLVKIASGDMEFVVKIASKGKAAKGEITKNGRSVVESKDRTDIWETLGKGEYKLTVRAPKGTAFTMKLEVYQLEGQS
jgi:membrane carboxypeptidase/penicillin-binding protein PbpC